MPSAARTAATRRCLARKMRHQTWDASFRLGLARLGGERDSVAVDDRHGRRLRGSRCWQASVDAPRAGFRRRPAAGELVKVVDRRGNEQAGGGEAAACGAQVAQQLVADVAVAVTAERAGRYISEGVDELAQGAGDPVDPLDGGVPLVDFRDVGEFLGGALNLLAGVLQRAS